MKIKQGFVVRKVAGESIAVPVGARGKEFHGMIKLNESAAFLWNFFLKEHDENEAVKALCAEYETDEETAKRDVQAFLRTLVENGFAE